MQIIFRSKILLIIRALLHAICIAWAFVISFFIRPYTDLIPGIQLRIPPLDIPETMIFAAISIVLFRIIAYNHKSYSLEFFQNEKYHITQVFLPRTSILACIAYFGFGFLFIWGISRFILLLAVFLSFIFILVTEKIRAIFFTKILSSLTISVYGKDSVLVKTIITQLQQETPYHYENNSWSQFSKNSNATILVGNYNASELQHRIDQGRGLEIPFFHISNQEEIEHAFAQPQRIWSLLWWSVSTTPLQHRWLIKRSWDFGVSLIWLLCCIPLFITIAIAIKTESPGPVFYIQKRVGRWGKHFNFIKFRSMYTHLSTGENYGWRSAELLKKTLIESPLNIRKGILSKFKDDPRVTKIGRFLRKSSLDELPSLYNVLIWEMSLVWPRPHEPHEVAKYHTRHKRLFTIKPGITGYAQLHGRDQVPFDEEAKLDLRYIQHWSFWFDLYILLVTCKVIVKWR